MLTKAKNKLSITSNWDHQLNHSAHMVAANCSHPDGTTPTLEGCPTKTPTCSGVQTCEGCRPSEVKNARC